MGGQPPARGPDPAHEGLASGPPPCSAISLQSGPRNPSQKNAGFMSEIKRRVNVRTNSEQPVWRIAMQITAIANKI